MSSITGIQQIELLVRMYFIIETRSVTLQIPGSSAKPCIPAV
jgi:hypothetical protein